MAKMKIYEIVSSMQRQFPNLQNKDVVTLLQENGFEVKGSQSVIEDDAIGFLLKHAKEHLSDSKKKESAKKKEQPKKAEAKAETSKKADEAKAVKEETKAAKKAEPEKETKEVKKAEVKEEVKEAKAEKEEIKEKTAVETEKKIEKAEETKPEKETKETEKKGKEETVQAEEKKDITKKEAETEKEIKSQETKKETKRDNKENRNNGNRDNRNGGNRDDRDNKNGGNRDDRDNRNGNRDNRNGGNRDNRNGNRDNRNGGNRDNRNGNRDNRNSGNRDNRNGNRDNRNGGNRDNRNGNRDNRNGNPDNRNGNRDNRNGGNRDNRNRNGNGGGFSRGPAVPMDSMKSEVKQSRQQRANKDSRSAKQRHGRERDRDMDDEEMFTQGRKKKKDPNRKGAFIKPEPIAKPQEPEDGIRTITLPEKMTIKELSDIMKVTPSTVIKNLFMRGQVVTLNHEITFEEAEEIALEYNCIAEMEEKVDKIAEILKEDEEDESLMVKRPPVVCVMGHVDHGKTSLLDAIRETSVTSREAGGITQHIGAYVTEINGEKITFLDTPGHEAFTSMRMRGAQSTDIAILVVAADDGVMPQTIEAISHAKAAGVEIIVAVNKIDKPSANIERVKQELTEHGLIAEDWGGDTVFVPVSAHTKEGIDQLLEMIILTAEVLELKANPNRKARGVVIEAQLDKGRGPVATVLVQKGTLHVGDNIAVGAAYGKIRAMMDDQGKRVKTALPSTPVEILGLHDVPDAGEIFMATDSDKEARNIAEVYIEQGREKLLDDTKSKLTLDGLFSQIQAGNIKELNLIVKADVQGSVEAVKQSLLKLSNDEVAVRIIHGAVGAINESDVSLASASNAIIIGFNVRPDNTAKEIADREKVDVRLYRVIYNAIEDIEAAMKGMLDPEYEEKVIGHAEVRQTFKASGVGMIAGSYVLDGKIERNCKVRISREGEQIFEGELASLKRFKDDVKEVAAGYECGLVFEGFNDIKVEDQVEAYIMVEVPRS